MKWFVPYIVGQVLSLDVASGQVDEFSAGLLFGNQSYPPATELILTPNSPFHVENQFFLSFDFAIWDYTNFGYIFQIESTSLECIVLSHLSFNHPDTSNLVLSLNRKDEIINMLIANEDLKKDKWHTITFEFDLLANRVTARFDNNVFEAEAYLENSMDFSLLFGNENQAAAVPRMVLRNVTISSKRDGEPDHHWPLAEVTGEMVHDIIGGHHGIQKGGEWLARRHMTWRRIVEITRPRGETTLIDPIQKKIIFVGSDGIAEWSWDERVKIDIPFANRLTLLKPHFLYDAVSEDLLALHGGKGQVSIFDRDTRTWSEIDTLKNSDDYYQTIPYFDGTTGDLFLFGGYGRFQSKNHIQQYNFDRAEWDLLDTKGDRIDPRSNILSAPGFEEGEILLAGGYGNLSGKHEHSFKYFQDLWEFNTKNQVLTKIADFSNELPGIGFHGLLTIPHIPNLYLIGSTIVDNAYISQLYEVNTETQDLKVLGDSLSFIPSGLYFDAERKEIILTAVQSTHHSDSSAFHIYVLDYPPQPLSPFAPLLTTVQNPGAAPLPWLFLIVLLAVVTLGYGLWNSWGSILQKSDIGRDASARLETKKTFQAPLCIHVFNSYRVLLNGMEIQNKMWGGDKTRKLFLYLVLNDHSGVPVEQVDFEFWPNSDHSSARNSRNVAISNIRRALGDIGSQVIIRENNHVKYSGDTKDHCDLYLFNELLNNHHPSKEQLVEAIEIFGNHGLAPSVEEKWIDPIREYYHQKVRRAARSLALIYTKDNQWKALTRLGRKILLWDDLDDDGIRMLVIGLKERDKPFMAHNEYHKYNDRYLEEMGDKYEISFERMVVT